MIQGRCIINLWEPWVTDYSTFPIKWKFDKMEISSDFCMFILDKMEIWSKIEEILTPRADFRQISAGLFSIKWKFLKILANNRQNGIPFHRECTVACISTQKLWKNNILFQISNEPFSFNSQPIWTKSVAKWNWESLLLVFLLSSFLMGRHYTALSKINDPCRLDRFSLMDLV